jgi:tRNA dimethylallyltransferase
LSRTKKFLIIIAGPTAVGKTSVAIQLANYFNTEIISADSRQIFEELNIGVARPSIDELNAVKHHFIANKSIRDYFSAGEYEREVIALLEELFKTKNVVYFVVAPVFISMQFYMALMIFLLSMIQ